MELIFWLFLFIIFYTYIGYGLTLWVFVKIRRMLTPAKCFPSRELQTCTVIVPAYNEEEFIEQKILNCLALEYPAGRLEIILVTDGSTDRTQEIAARFPEVQLLHRAQRGGKAAAMNRAAAQVKDGIIVFTDANTLLNKTALIHIARCYDDLSVGTVAGEKRVAMQEAEDAGAAGEGLYWKYESRLKCWDGELYSVVGAAGELFSVRKDLYQDIEKDTILDDFMISLRIAMQGHRTAYAPEAYAVESGSEDIREELKRKIRIAAGGIQSVVRLRALLNIFKYGVLSFQYISHRVLRWTITPFTLAAVFPLNIMLFLSEAGPVYSFLLIAQVIFYMMALAGYLLESKKLRLKVLFIPYYFCLMNYAVLGGIIRYFSGRQNAIWDKSKRRTARLSETTNTLINE